MFLFIAVLRLADQSQDFKKEHKITKNQHYEANSKDFNILGYDFKKLFLHLCLKKSTVRAFSKKNG